VGRRKVVGSAGRFGPRYGGKIRAKVTEVERTKKQRFTCPKCNMPFVVRVSPGIWECKKCGNKFSGLAYTPQSQLESKEEK
jgi:large subunit ribosomal protein L37Ae